MYKIEIRSDNESRLDDLRMSLEWLTEGSSCIGEKIEITPVEEVTGD